jgi:hypothetical protein
MGLTSSKKFGVLEAPKPKDLILVGYQIERINLRLIRSMLIPRSKSPLGLGPKNERN